MESAFCIVDNRCATIKHVLPTIIFSRASWTRFSEALSSALVALVHSLLFFLLCIFFYSIFSLSLLFAHSLTQFCHTALSPQSHLLGLLSFSHFIKWPNGLFLLFLSPFLPSTLFTSNHNKCKPLTLTLLQPKSPFLPLLRPNGLCIFLFFFLQRVQHS